MRSNDTNPNPHEHNTHLGHQALNRARGILNGLLRDEQVDHIDKGDRLALLGALADLIGQADACFGGRPARKKRRFFSFRRS